VKITDVKGVNVCVPLNLFGEYQPVSQWYGTRYAALKCIVFINTDAGITGLGECGTEGEHLLQGLKSRMIDKDPYDVNAILREINHQGRILFGTGHLDTRMLNVSGGISMALWDIIGKDCNKPIYKLIGGKYRERIELRAWLTDQTAEQQAEVAVKCVEAGWKSLKIKGGRNPEHDVNCVKTIREAVGDRIEIGVDCNGRYTAGMAIRTIKKMEKYDLSYMEEPTTSRNINAFAKVRRHVDTMLLCCGHGCTTKELIREMIEKDAVDSVNLDLVRNGGFLETQRCAAVAEAGGIVASTHSSPGELGIATAAQIYLQTATPNFTWCGDSGYMWVLPPSKDIITKPFEYDNGTLTVPEGSGLGIEIHKENFREARKRYETELEHWRHVIGRDPRVMATQHAYFYDYPEKYEWQDSEWPFKIGSPPYTLLKEKK